MGNVLRILKRDFKRLLKAPAALIVVGALLVLPSLYTWYNVLAFWNPYEATGNLRVCVVNQDIGTETEMTGQLNVGEKVLEAMLENEQLDWTTEGYDQAMDDLKVGNVYAVYVIPENFSACLLSPLSGEVISPHIQYYANEKLGPVSPKITDAAANALNQTINSTFVATVTEAATEAVDNAVKGAGDNVANARLRADAQVGEARASVQEVRVALANAQDTIADVRSKVAGANNALDGASTLVDDAQVILQDAVNEADALQDGLLEISSDAVPKLSAVLDELTEVSAKASRVADDIASYTGVAQSDVDMAAARMQPVVSVMRNVSDDLRAAAIDVSDESLKNRLSLAAQDMSERANDLQAALDGATALAGEIETASQKAAEVARSLDEGAMRASDNLIQYANDLHGTAVSSITSGVAQVESVCANLSTATQSLGTALEQARPALGRLDSILVDCGNALQRTDASIGTLQGDLDSIVGDVRLLTQSNAVADLLGNGTLNAQNISEFMGAPTELSTTKLYHPNVYGTAMAPLFMSLTFWIGAFMLVIIFRLEVDAEGLKEPKLWQLYLGRFCMFGIFAILQAVICCAGTLALGVQATNVPAFFLASIAASLAFLSIIYALSATFRHIGQGLCIVLVFAQIPGGTGLYPIELTSSFFQAIYPFLPFSYAIDALREAIGGLYGNSFAHDLVALGAFFFGNVLLGLLLGPLMANVVRMTARQIHEGDLFNGEDVKTPERPYRLTHVLRALTEKEDYRAELEKRYARFSRRYPIFIRVAIVLGVGVPVLLALLTALDAAEKVLLVTLFLFWLVGLILFLVWVESQRYSFERQLNLDHMSAARLLNIFSERNRMVQSSLRITGRRARSGESETASEGEAAPAGEGAAGASDEPHDEDPEAGQEESYGIRNIGIIMRRDFAGLFKNVMSVVITLGLVALPSIFVWYNILACWDVFNNTGNLSVAVASKDVGFESDLVPINVNIGDKVVSALRANKQINWVFTDADDAIEGTESGKYYAALVIPEGFSTDMLTFYQGDSASATIDYYVNEKKNAIAPNITGTGADTVSYEVNATFAKTLSEVLVGVAQSLSKLVQSDDLTGRVGALSEHMRGIASRIEQSVDVLNLYASLGRNSQGLLAGSVDLLESVQKRIGSTTTDIDEGKRRLQELAASLSESIDNLDSSLQEASATVASLEEDADAMARDVVGGVSSTASQLRDKASDLNGKAVELSGKVSELEELRALLKSLARGLSRPDDSTENANAQNGAQDDVLMGNTLVLDECIATLSKAVEILQRVSATCMETADNLEMGSADALDDVEALKALSEQARADAQEAKTNLEASLMPGIDSIKADVATLEADFNEATANLGNLSTNLPGAVGAVATSIGDISLKVEDAGAKLQGVSRRMRDIAGIVDSAMVSGNTDRLRSLLQEDAQDLATALTSPVQIDRTALFPSENFGSSMAPLYCTLALFIGSLLIMVAMKPEVSRRGREQLRNPKPRHLYFGRFGAVAFVSLAQTTLLGLGCLFFLKVQAADPVLFMLCFWISGLVFAFIVYTLVVAFGNLGKAIAVLLLIVQVTACGGSYPLQILPDFVQAISPWVPATYIVDALRAAMMGVYQNDFWVSMGHLALFLIPFLLLGLALRKPLERFMKFYVSKVEECGIME